MTTIIYHANCADGFTAAWCAWRKFGDSARYVAAQYGEDPPDCAGDDVVIVDFSYPRAVLESLHRTTNSLLVLDHHKTAQAQLDGLSFCKFDMDRSGARMAEAEWHDEPTKLVQYVEDRDLWRWALPDSREINAYIGVVHKCFPAWNVLAAELEWKTEKVIDRGRAVLASVNAYVETLVTEIQTVRIGGYEVPCLNTTYAHSELIGAIAERNPEASFAAGWFQRKDGAFVYSLRSRGGFDVSEVAKLYGGGGHKAAAGFTANRIFE